MRKKLIKKKPDPKIQDQLQLFFKLFFGTGRPKITEDEVAYFRENPDKIDDFSAPVSVHKIFLLFGLLLGIVLVGMSKILKYSSLLADFSEGLREFCFDIVFEIGVALIGAVATAYLLGILLNRQQSDAKTWRTELRRRINQKDNHR